MASTSAARCKEPCGREAPSTAGAAVAISLSSGSSAITKTLQRQPKIRIVHIFAPEIIKAEAHDFRALVQRLTGKTRVPGRRRHQRATNNSKKQQPEEATKRRSPQHVEPKRDPEARGEDRIPMEEIKIEPCAEEEEGEGAWEDVRRMSSGSSNRSNSSSSGGFLDALGDLYGFGDLHWSQLLLPMASSSTHVDV